MKKKLAVLIVILILVVLAFPVANLVMGPDNAGLLSGSRSDGGSFPAAVALLEKKCSGCHVPDADLPFYAGLPVAGSMIGEDIERGLRFLNLKEAFGDADSPVSEVALAKIEHVAERGDMPPGRYLALHWDSSLSAEDVGVLQRWIDEVREEHYATGAASGEHALGAVQPLTPPEDLDPEMVALGDRLYHDTRLSGDDTVSCASCHGLDKGGTDQLQFSEGIRGQVGGINAPTVFNAGFAVRQFWDGRAADLVEQAGGPVTNPIEMGAEWPDVIAKLEQDPGYVLAFGALFEDGITPANVQEAIAHFEESLVTPGSDFDAWLMGDANALGVEAHAGWELFQERGCVTCHVGAALGGQSFEHMGLYQDYFAEKGEVGEADLGLFNFSGRESDKHRFKVPTLRNVAVTWPYFHDGSTSDLEEAVRVMARCQCDEELDQAGVRRVATFLRALTGDFRGKRLE